MIAGALSAAPQDPSHRFSSLDIFNIQVATDPQISPDGATIVYVRQFNDIQSDKRCSNLWTIHFDGTNNKALTSGNYTDSSPTWSPDGTSIAYVSDRDGSPQIYVLRMDTGQTVRLTSLALEPSTISWSPDGKRIAFDSFVPAARREITVLPTPPPGAQWADAPEVYDRLLYRADARGYLKPGFTQIFVIPAAGGAPQQLTTGNFPHGRSPFGFGGGDIKWTPDGKYLVTSGHFQEDYEYDPFDMNVYEISAADGAVRVLTNGKGPYRSPDISPDGKQIAYIGFEDHHQQYQTTRLYVMNRNGGNSHVVTTKLDRDVQDPRWSPDGKNIYFLFDDQGDTKLGYASLDGNVRVLAEHVGSGSTSYSGGALFTVARNGAIAFTRIAPEDPGSIAVKAASSPREDVLTALNKQLFQNKKFGQLDEFWFDSSLDHRKIQGWILKPPDFDPFKKYPLLLEIHGGSSANYGARFDTVKQIWSANGYVVVYVNPRGSSSYGEEFGNLTYHAYPGDDFYDLNSGVDAVIAKGYIDPGNLFVTGGSGGGILTCWVIDRTTRFRAAASLYPAVNWYSWALTSDMAAFPALYMFPGFPWDNPDHYLKRSPISYVKNVKTPTLLMTGDQDYRTPIWETEQYYAALKLLGVETVLVRVPGEPHGLRERPSHVIATTLYVLSWFDQHRK